MDWEGALRGLGQGLAQAGQQWGQHEQQKAMLRLTDDVQQKREARMQQYRQAEIVDERAYQDGVRHEGYAVSGVMAERKAEAAAAKTAAANAENDRRAERDARLTLARDARKLEGQRSLIEHEGKHNPASRAEDSADTYADEFAKGLAVADREMYQEAKTKFNGIARMEASLDVMESIGEEFKTGRVEDYFAKVGELLGTDAAAARQAFNGAQVPMVIGIMESMAGPQTDQDMILYRESLPSYDKDPRANAIINGLNRKYIELARENYLSMQSHLDDQRARNVAPGLQDWVSPVGMRPIGETSRRDITAAENAGQAVSAGDPLGLFD